MGTTQHYGSTLENSWEYQISTIFFHKFRYLVQSGKPPDMKGNSYWRYIHFPLNQYGRKGSYFGNLNLHAHILHAHMLQQNSSSNYRIFLYTCSFNKEIRISHAHMLHGTGIFTYFNAMNLNHCCFFFPEKQPPWNLTNLNPKNDGRLSWNVSPTWNMAVILTHLRCPGRWTWLMRHPKVPETKFAG